MAKSKEKIKARELRKKGRSIKDIAKRLKVAKSSVSKWCKGIELTPAQIRNLEKKMLLAGYRGRIKGAKIQSERRSAEIADLKREGSGLLKSLSKRDLFLIGTGLYWGEGVKKGRVRIANSDPRMIKFLMSWLINIWEVSKKNLVFQVLINQLHKDRVKQVEDYWAGIAGVSSDQFIKTTLIKSKNKKIYKNFNDHYGTLIITVRKSSNLRYKIEGVILRCIDKCPKIIKAA